MGFKVGIVGAGPAGLYFAYMMKKRNPTHEISVIEQNSRDATYGFGMVLSRRAIEFLRRGDAHTMKLVEEVSQQWRGQTINHRGTEIFIDGDFFSAIERLSLLKILQGLCEEAGVIIQFDTKIESINNFTDCDLIVAADGSNSVIRDIYADKFGTKISELRNYFAWYGVARTYPTHTLAFRESNRGIFCGHYYRYTSEMSTFIAECNEKTWKDSGMAAMTDDQRRELMEETFSEELNANPLISNRSTWRHWRLATNKNWYHNNIVLIGDALRSAHPSIGSGTRLAMEDSIALFQAFELENDDVSNALERYQRERRPIREKLDRAAAKSIAWYEDIADKLPLAPYDFVYDYLMRTGIMTQSRLEKQSPQFMKKYRDHGALPSAITTNRHVPKLGNT